MSGNALLPTRAQHDRHYAHACIVCGASFSHRRRGQQTPGRRPAGQILHCGTWGDACAPCHTFLTQTEEPTLFTLTPPLIRR